MINPTEKELIISILGNHYSKAIAMHLQKKKLINRDGKPYSQESIRMFVNGERENSDVELHILKFAKTTQKRKAAAEQKRKSLTEKS